MARVPARRRSSAAGPVQALLSKLAPRPLPLPCHLLAVPLTPPKPERQSAALQVAQVVARATFTMTPRMCLAPPCRFPFLRLRPPRRVSTERLMNGAPLSSNPMRAAELRDEKAKVPMSVPE